MKAKRLLALLLAIVMVCAVLVACGDKDNGGDKKGGDVTASGDELYSANVPEGTSFNNETVRVMSIDPDLYPSMLTAFDFEEDQDDVVNAAIFKRDRVIESKYQVKFQTEYMDIAETYPALIENVDAGDDNYQLMMPHPVFNKVDGGMFDLDYVGDIFPHEVYETNEKVDIIASSFLTGSIWIEGAYKSFYEIIEKDWGKGKVMLNALYLLEKLDCNPLAGLILMNVVKYISNK